MIDNSRFHRQSKILQGVLHSQAPRVLWEGHGRRRLHMGVRSHIFVRAGPECKCSVLPVYADGHLSNPLYNYDGEQREHALRELRSRAAITGWQ